MYNIEAETYAKHPVMYFECGTSKFKTGNY